MKTENLLNPQGIRKNLVLFVISLLVFAVYVLVYTTGGIKFVFSHTMYIPIILASFMFQVKGGVIVGILAGLALGPLMPIDVATGEQQTTINWLYRMAVFVAIGATAGQAVHLLKKHLERVTWLSTHDSFSELPNRLKLVGELNKIKDRNMDGKGFSLIVLNADNLYEIADIFGIGSSDHIIKQIFITLAEKLPASACLFHYHRDRFAILLPESNSGVIKQYVDLLSELLKQPILVDEFPLYIEAYIGYIICASDNEAASPHELIQKADLALLHAKKEGFRNYLYQDQIASTSKSNVALLGSMTSAIEHNQLVLHYQPKVNMQAKSVIGVEALVRWDHPTQGLIPPLDFIPQAEKTHLINHLTNWVMAKALLDLSEWREQGYDLSMAVNISPRNLQNPMFFSSILKELNKYHIEPDNLELEITETALMISPENSVTLLTHLKNLRIIVSVDDFGSGYSSLSYLHKLPVSTVKISRQFIASLLTDKGARHIVEAAIYLAHSLGMKAIAEGVEDQETYDMLFGLGCDIIQGFYVCPPLSGADFITWYPESEWR